MRVKFDSSSASTLTIGPAYLDERSSGEDAVNPPVTATPGTTRIQLYFTDGLGNIATSVTISAGGSVYSNWAIFPIDSSKDYFVTFYVSGGLTGYWPGTQASDVNSYLMGGDHASQAKWSSADPLVYLGHEVAPPYEDGKYTSSANTYAEASIEAWSNSGSVTTEIYDTKVTDPNYNPITWDDNKPAGSDVTVYGRSSDSPLMTGAVWTSNMILGTGRYAQFKADLTATSDWTCIDHPAVAIADEDYKNNGVITCPTCSKYLVPAIDASWVDNLMVTWQGEERMCDISGFFAQKPDYGIIKLTIDGNDIVKGWEFTATVYEDFQAKSYQASLGVEVEPRNTGK